jgi:hypothetical protein
MNKIITFFLLIFLTSPILSDDRIWTDFSPKPKIIIEEDISEYVDVQEIEYNITLKSENPKLEIDKEKYRKLFEDKELILMVLGGIEWWNINCGTLSKTGEYFMNLAIEKHNINKDDMRILINFQIGHFTAALYNDCDIFLEQVDSIDLKMMFIKEIKLD